MCRKNLFYSTLSLFLLICFPLLALTINKQDHLINSIASLTYHISELKEEAKSHLQNEQEKRIPGIEFSEADVAALWNEIGMLASDFKGTLINCDAIQLAYNDYYNIQNDLTDQDFAKRHQQLVLLHKQLDRLWEQVLDVPKKHSRVSSLMTNLDMENPHFESNPHISLSIKNLMRPYIIPLNHPMKARLDKIFSKRVTLNKLSLKQAGFIQRGKQRPRSFVIVAAHPDLPKYLVKLYLDNELRRKFRRPSWYWLIQRCKGVEKVHLILKKYKIKHFVAPHKWIYPLPAEPSPLTGPRYTRHLAVLLVDDMHLTNEKSNKYAWGHYITQDHLKELYFIISRAKGCSYRPDNIAYTKKGKFAFIDTEYPGKGPDYNSIRPHLSSSMRHYWDKLIKTGGQPNKNNY